VEEQQPTPPMALPARLLNVFFSPGQVFEGLREKPSWFGALALSGVLVALSMALIPADIWVQMFREQASGEGTELLPFLESAGPLLRVFSALAAVIGLFFWAFLLAGIITLVFSFLFGDEGKYTQYLSVVSHALVITAVAAVLLLPLRIIQEDPQLTLNLGTFFLFLEEGYLFRVLKRLDLFGLWGSAVMAVGVTKVDPRRGMGFALSFFLAFALASAMVFGIFGG
jgi:hypothetical protein